LSSDQFARLLDLRNELESRGFLHFYTEPSELREKVLLHVTTVVSDLLRRESGSSVEILTASRPDIRVLSAISVVMYGQGEPVAMIAITVQNHAPLAVFLMGVQIELEDGQHLFVQFDSATRQPNGRRRLESGDSFDFHVHMDDVRRAVEPESLRRVVVRDAVGRIYHSDEENFKQQIRILSQT